MTSLTDTMRDEADGQERPPELSYGALFLRFLRFGVMAFGGPVAQIAMIRRELVDEERWIASGSFNKLLAVMQVLPGPEAHELCVHLGIRAKGRIGGLLAGLGFMLPGLILMLALAWLYSRLAIEGTVLGSLFIGVQAAVLAVILRAVHRIGEHILLDKWLWAVAAAAGAATLSGVSFWIVLPASGAAYALAMQRRYWLVAIVLVTAAVAAILSAGGAADWARASNSGTQSVPSTLALFIAGLKGGLLTFGGAYTAIPFVRNDTVGRGWMTDAQFLDGLALSGVIPAPLVIFSTFVGWISGGPMGALAITAGCFFRRSLSRSSSTRGLRPFPTTAACRLSWPGLRLGGGADRRDPPRPHAHRCARDTRPGRERPHLPDRAGRAVSLEEQTRHPGRARAWRGDRRDGARVAGFELTFP